MSELIPQDHASQINPPQQDPQQMILPGMAQIVMQAHSGPIPSPELLAGYERAVPGSGDRIIKMAEQQAIHRQQLESAALTAQTADRRADRLEHRIGQIFALVIGVVALIASVLIVVLVPTPEGATVASIVGGSTVIGLVTVFVVGNHQSKRDSKTDPKKNT
jgi:uncharacterized membrane protein